MSEDFEEQLNELYREVADNADPAQTFLIAARYLQAVSLLRENSTINPTLSYSIEYNSVAFAYCLLQLSIAMVAEIHRLQPHYRFNQVKGDILNNNHWRPGTAAEQLEAWTLIYTASKEKERSSVHTLVAEGRMWTGIYVNVAYLPIYFGMKVFGEEWVRGFLNSWVKIYEKRAFGLPSENQQ